MIEEPSRLAARRGDRSDVYFQHLAATGVLQRRLIKHCLPEFRLGQDVAAIVNHDDRAAFVRALTALCVAAGDFTAIGDDDGWILLPPHRVIQLE